MSPERRALFMLAAWHQGGHSEAGTIIAETLGVPFPLRMTTLIDMARAEGENPAAMWRWMITAHQDRNSFFTPDEIAAAKAQAA